ncbi:MAG: preprotein translocase subunit SecE [Psittacicella sp.]
MSSQDLKKAKTSKESSKRVKEKNNSKIAKTSNSYVSKLLWVVAILFIIAAALIENYATFETIEKTVISAILLVIGIVIFGFTLQGKKVRKFIGDSRVELRRIVWPTRQNAIRTTIIVIAITVIVSLFLWLFDTIFLSAITYITSIGI